MYNNVKEYKLKMENLFSEWEQRSGSIIGEKCTYLIDHKNGTFVRDGVICPEKWFEQKNRPLFLLKEAYGEGKDWNLIDDQLRKSYSIGKSITWRRVSEWTCGLMSTTKDTIVPYHSWDSIKNYDNPYLQQAAVVNVKKSGGINGSDMDNIRAYAEFDKELLHRQLEICDPTVIVCGYTSSVLDIVYEISVRKSKNENLYYYISINGHDVLVLDYWHPANQYPDIMNYYGLMGIYQQALINDKK